MNDIVDKRLPGEPSLSYRKRIHPWYKGQRREASERQNIELEIIMERRRCLPGRHHHWYRAWIAPGTGCECYSWQCALCGKQQSAVCLCPEHDNV